jgi:hypothetical protein
MTRRKKKMSDDFRSLVPGVVIMPLIPVLTPIECDYVSAFGISAVGVSNRGRVLFPTTRMTPAGYGGPASRTPNALPMLRVKPETLRERPNGARELFTLRDTGIPKSI